MMICHRADAWEFVYGHSGRIVGSRSWARNCQLPDCLNGKSRGGARGVTKAELSGTLIQRTTSEAPQRPALDERLDDSALAERCSKEAPRGNRKNNGTRGAGAFAHQRRSYELGAEHSCRRHIPDREPKHFVAGRVINPRILYLAVRMDSAPHNVTSVE